MQSQNLLAAVADTLVPGVTIEDDGALRAELAPFARTVEARRPGSEFASWRSSSRPSSSTGRRVRSRIGRSDRRE